MGCSEKNLFENVDLPMAAGPQTRINLFIPIGILTETEGKESDYPSKKGVPLAKSAAFLKMSGMRRDHPYSQSKEDFLEALLMLEESNEPLETTRVAKILGISKPAVHQMGHELIDLELITRKDYGDMKLTDKGREVAKKTLERHHVLEEFLRHLGVSEETAKEDCCEIEHAISEETFQRIKEFIQQK